MHTDGKGWPDCEHCTPFQVATTPGGQLNTALLKYNQVTPPDRLLNSLISKKTKLYYILANIPDEI
jgi:hypothetical protein